MIHDYAQSNFIRNRIIEITQQKNLELSDNAIKQEQNLIEQQGYNKVKQSFNQVANTYNNITGAKDVVYTENFPKYQNSTSQKELNTQIYADLTQIIDPNFKVNLVDDYGNIVIGDTGPALVPTSFYSKINDIINQAQQLAHVVSTSIIPGQSFTIEQLKEIANIWDLSKFKQGGEWDVQRLYSTSGIDKDTRDISTINIGIYAAASGMSLDDILTIEDSYARFFSKFNWNQDTPDKIYIHLPVRNVNNTKIGYDLYKNGKIKGQ